MALITSSGLFCKTWQSVSRKHLALQMTSKLIFVWRIFGTIQIQCQDVQLLDDIIDNKQEFAAWCLEMRMDQETQAEQERCFYNFCSLFLSLSRVISFFNICFFSLVNYWIISPLQASKNYLDKTI